MKLPLIPTFLCALGASLLLSASFVRSANVEPIAAITPIKPIQRIVPYFDEDYGFTLAVPENWSRVIAAEDEHEVDVLEPGYAVAFESPKSHDVDVFADYLMVEILPGAQSGAFSSDGSRSKVTMVDERVAITDQVFLNDYDINGDRIDLVVFQAEIIELGFTVGIFAIGEKREADILEDAFKLALKTFKIPEDPFSVS